MEKDEGGACTIWFGVKIHTKSDFCYIKAFSDKTYRTRNEVNCVLKTSCKLVSLNTWPLILKNESKPTLIEYLIDDLMVKLRYIVNAKYKNDLCLLTGNICNISNHIIN